MEEISATIKPKSMILEIGAQDYDYKSKFNNNIVHTLDICELYNPTYVGDITKHNEMINDDTYDYIICTEVLEHVENPFNAIIEMNRILKKGALYLY